MFVSGTLVRCAGGSIILADESTVTFTRSGDLLITLQNADLRLSDVLLVPYRGYNLFSVGKRADQRISSMFRHDHVRVSLDDQQLTIGNGKNDLENGLYLLPSPETNIEISLLMTAHHEADLWHKILVPINWKHLSMVHFHADGVPKLSLSKDTCRV